MPIIYLLILLSGFASLSWEVIWQIKSSLALGASAWGAALTLAVMMGGMSLGGFMMGKTLHKTSFSQALKLYGSLEIVTGIAGMLLAPMLILAEKVDTWAYTSMPNSAGIIYLTSISLAIMLPTLCMGATFPLFGLLAKELKSSTTKLYSLNTLGAAIGVLAVAFTLIPLLGIANTIMTIAGINIIVGLSAWLLSFRFNIDISHQPNDTNMIQECITFKDAFIIFITGFATFTLEIAWFRSLSSTFPNTTDVFAIMLACVLIALGLAAKNISKLKIEKKSLGTQLCLAGIFILLTTPLIERFDTFFSVSTTDTAINSSWLLNSAVLFYFIKTALLILMTSLVIIPPLQYLGVAFPWIIDQYHSPKALGKLYAISTLACIAGAITTAWALLPTIGFVKSAWLAGVLVMIVGVLITPNKKRVTWGAFGFSAFFVAIWLQTGIGSTRVQGLFANINHHPAKVLASIEGPQATISAIEYQDGARALLINSASAANEHSHYMAWMGRLPMLLQAHPQHALVICFGSGQTANAVKQANPLSLDIVDINSQAFKLAPYFKSNGNVLNQAGVKSIVMDGRAYLRRSRKQYGVITLEPMPPTTVGVNALYSREFYELARKRLSSNGVIAQWLPFHAVAPHYAESIAKTFIAVFPNAILWIDPISRNGILLGANNRDIKLTTTEIQKNIALNSKELKEYSRGGEIISDDNQLLAYGKALYISTGLLEENLALVHRFNHT